MTALPFGSTRAPVSAPFWTRSATELFETLSSIDAGRSVAGAARRLAAIGPNTAAEAPRSGPARAILRRLPEPLSLILLAASLVSATSGDIVGGSIIIAILAVSIGLVTGTTAIEARNALFRSAVVQTGEPMALVVGTGRHTIFGGAAATLAEGAELSPIQRDLRAYGLPTARLTIGLVLVMLATSVFFGRPLPGLKTQHTRMTRTRPCPGLGSYIAPITAPGHRPGTGAT